MVSFFDSQIYSGDSYFYLNFTDKTKFKKEISDLLKATQGLSSRTERQIHLFGLQILDISSHQPRFSYQLVIQMTLVLFQCYFCKEDLLVRPVKIVNIIKAKLQ